MRVSTRLQRRLLLLTLLLLALGGIVSRVEAADGMRGDRCEVGVNDVINDDFYFFCRILDVRGTINGDLVGIASSVTIHASARVAGDVWVGGGELVVAGKVGDDVRFGGVSLVISNQARLASPRIDVIAVALNTVIAPDAVLPGDLLVFGYQAQIDGTIGGDVDFVGEALLINGEVLGTVDAEVGDSRRNTDVPSLPFYNVTFSDPGLRIAPDARIEGDLYYDAASPSVIPIRAVQGRLRFQQTGGQPDITRAERPDDAAQILSDYLLTSFRDVVTMILLGAVGMRFAPDIVRQPAIQVRRRTVPTIGWGLLTFMLSIPIIITVFVLGLILVLLLYLLSLSELMLMVGAGVLIATAVLVGGISFLLFFMGRLVISFMFGYIIYRYVLNLVEPGTYRRWMEMLVVGAAVYALMINVPLPALGITMELVTVLSGIGAVVMYMRQRLLESNLFAPQTAAVDITDATPLLSVSTPVQAHKPESVPPPGMENLPEGFTGFDEDW